jgi:hypothetical protein
LGFTLNPGIAKDTLDTVMEDLPVWLPNDYIGFLLVSNGGEGFLGENYVRLWKAEDLRQNNLNYAVAEFAPQLFLFGSDGGGEAYAFDTSASPYMVVQVPFIGMGDPETSIQLGDSFNAFLTNLGG